MSSLPFIMLVKLYELCSLSSSLCMHTRMYNSKIERSASRFTFSEQTHTKNTLKLRASQQNIPCKLSILGCLCMEERAFRKLSIDGNPDSTSIYDTALKLKELLINYRCYEERTNKLLKTYRNLRMLLIVASASMRELRQPLNFLSLKMLCSV